ncbi:MAG: monovalent cation/H+ antiporter complex subunit F [Marinilabiliales bacterium]|nr:monovalent cation/H+ antiporter complex subunit F [Marinilabiliales bacterium]
MTLLRVIPGPERNDRIVSLTAAVTMWAAAALVLSIASGDLFILDAAIIVTLLLFAGIVGCIKFCGGEGQ